jgi:glycine/D-amino acid oxidase-like deaminating enzyme
MHDCLHQKHLVQEIESSEFSEDINFNGKEYNNIQEMVDDAKKFGCDSVLNCTGLGSRLTCADESLVGARGVLLLFDRASCRWDIQPASRDSVIMIEDPPLGSETAPCYMIPRGNIIAVGGTYLLGDGEVGIRSDEMSRIMQNARTMGINTDKSKPPSQWIGFRPYRHSARLEIDDKYSEQDVKVVHSFGYGGSGWTVFVGAAKEAVDLVSCS